MRALLAIVTFAACVPELPSLEGKACDDQHPCGEGYRCTPSTCDGPAEADLLENGAFEAGAGLPGWYASPGGAVEAQRTQVLDGGWAGRASATSSGSSSFGLAGLRPTRGQLEPGATYCAEGHVDRDALAPSARLRMFLRFWSEAGDFRDVETAAGPDAGWQRLRASGTAVAPHDFGLTVRFSAEGPSPATFVADEVRAWRSVGFVCRTAL